MAPAASDLTALACVAHCWTPASQAAASAPLRATSTLTSAPSLYHPCSTLVMARPTGTHACMHAPRQPSTHLTSMPMYIYIKSELRTLPPPYCPPPPPIHPTSNIQRPAVFIAAITDRTGSSSSSGDVSHKLGGGPKKYQKSPGSYADLLKFVRKFPRIHGDGNEFEFS